MNCSAKTVRENDLKKDAANFQTVIFRIFSLKGMLSKILTNKQSNVWPRLISIPFSQFLNSVREKKIQNKMKTNLGFSFTINFRMAKNF